MNITEVCGQKLPCKATFEKHMRNGHSGSGSTEVEDDCHCSVCDKNYSTFKSVKDHMKIYKKRDLKEWLYCALCGESFCLRYLLNRHRCHELDSKLQQIESDVEGKAGDNKCPICSRVFTIRYNWERHMDVHLGQQKHQCSMCCLKFSDTRDLRSHLISKHKRERRFKCSLCPKRFHWKSHLNRHEKIHDKFVSSFYVCCICGMSFVQKRDMQAHNCGAKQRGCSGQVAKYLCNVCGKCCVFMSCFKKHMKTHAATHQHTCSRCAKRFQSKESFKNHYMKQRVLSSSLRCETSRKKDVRSDNADGRKKRRGRPPKSRLVIHSEAHPVEEKFLIKNQDKAGTIDNTPVVSKAGKYHSQCKEYGTKFRYKTSLQEHSKSAHERIVGVQKQYQQYVCGRKVSCVKPVRNHLKMKKKERSRRSCALCGETFAGRYDLNRHACSLLDSGLLPRVTGSNRRRWQIGGASTYLCPICNSMFNIQTSWQRHMVVHLGQQRYKCPMCSRKFSCNRDARRHCMASHTMDWPQRCHFKPPSKMMWDKNMRKDDNYSNVEGWIPMEDHAPKDKLLNGDENISEKTPRKEKVGKYQCEECGKNFTYRRCYQKHMMSEHHRSVMHEKGFPFFCALCGERFPLQSHLNSHRCSALNSKQLLGMCQTKSQSGNYACAVCKKMFISKQTWKGHMSLHLGQQSHCRVQFSHSRSRDVRFHTKTHTGESIQTKFGAKQNCLCSACGKSCQFRPNLNSHQIGNTDSLPHLCRLCSKRFRCHVTLPYHTEECLLSTSRNCTAMPKNEVKVDDNDGSGMLKEHPPKSVLIADTEEHQHKDILLNEGQESEENTVKYMQERRCQHEECRENFKRKVSLQEHMKNVQSCGERNRVEDSYQCPVDGKKTTHVQIFRENMRILRGEDPRFSCALCGQRFVTRYRLNRHRCDKLESTLLLIESDASNENTRECAVCKRMFCSRKSWKSHIDVHLGQEKHQCPVCSKKFSSGKHLERHMRSHNGDRPFACKWCPKRCYSKSAVNAHEKIHKAGHRCDICGNSYTCLSSLMNHMSDHSPTHPYPCSRCGKRFRFKAGLGNHYKKEHLSSGFLHDECFSDDNKYQCAVCERRFIHYHNLEKHKDVHLMEELYQNSVNGDKVTREKTPHAQGHFCIQDLCGTVTPGLDMQSLEEDNKFPDMCNMVVDDCADNQKLYDRVMPVLTKHSSEENDKLPVIYTVKVEECVGSYDSSVIPDLRRQTLKEEYQCFLCDKKLSSEDELKTHLEIHCS